MLVSPTTRLVTVLAERPAAGPVDVRLAALGKAAAFLHWALLLHWAPLYRDLVSGAWRGAWPALLRGALAALEPLYAWEIARRNAGYERTPSLAVRAAAPVISVGNLTVGGVGKTPFAGWLVRQLLARGVQPALLSRGYGSRPGEPNDEWRELAAELPDTPHYQGRDRVALAEKAVAAGADVLVLDDGFQHRHLARDLDLVLLDALEPFGFGRLLPRGLLREPLASLARADVVALCRASAVPLARRQEIRQEVARWAPAAGWLELTHAPAGLVSLRGERIDHERLRGARVAAFAGLGNPAGFRHTLQECGAELVGFREFPDHYAYPQEAQRELAQWLAVQRAEFAVCTRKDLVKLAPQGPLDGSPLFALAISAACLAGEADLQRRLDVLVAAVRAHQAPKAASAGGA